MLTDSKLTSGWWTHSTARFAKMFCNIATICKDFSDDSCICWYMYNNRLAYLKLLCKYLRRYSGLKSKISSQLQIHPLHSTPPMMTIFKLKGVPLHACTLCCLLSKMAAIDVTCNHLHIYDVAGVLLGPPYTSDIRPYNIAGRTNKVNGKTNIILQPTLEGWVQWCKRIRGQSPHPGSYWWIDCKQNTNIAQTFAKKIRD